MMVADVLSSTTSEIGSKVLGHITEYGFLVAGSALYAIALLVILPKSGIRLFPERTRLTKMAGASWLRSPCSPAGLRAQVLGAAAPGDLDQGSGQSLRCPERGNAPQKV
jgi:hypothetical protein